ncbi:MAG: septum site-determining protein MinC [Halanaerobiales bacterium]
MKPSFSFQVTSRGVIVNLDPGVEFSRLKTSLINHVNEARDFFAGVDIYINLDNCIFDMGQLRQIMDIFSGYRNVGGIYFTAETGEKKQKQKSSVRDTVLHRGTIRSGQELKYPTNIVIIGDVNPGAEVTAAGDIIVLGRLRGVVHAGAGGREGSQVIALKLCPTQLRIAGFISRPPDKENTSLDEIRPEKAFVQEGFIVIEKLME